MEQEIVKVLNIITHPFGKDCEGQYFSTNSKVALDYNKRVWYKHGMTEFKFMELGKPLDFWVDPNLGGVTSIGLYDTPLLNTLVDAYEKNRLFASTAAISPTILDSGEILLWPDVEITLIDLTEYDSEIIPCSFNARSLDMFDPKLVRSNVEAAIATSEVKLKCGCALAATPTDLLDSIGEIIQNVVESEMQSQVMPDTTSGTAAMKSAAATPATDAEDKAEGAEPDAMKSAFKSATASLVAKAAVAVPDEDVEALLDNFKIAGITTDKDNDTHRTVLVALKGAGNVEAVNNYIAMLTGSLAQKSASIKVERATVSNKVTDKKLADEEATKLQRIAAEISGEILAAYSGE